MGYMALLPLALISVILVSSCVGSNSNPAQSPKDAYLSYITKSMAQQQFKIVYDMKIPVFGPLVSGMDTKIGIFRKGGRAKTVTESTTGEHSATSYVYTLQGSHIMCSRSSNLLASETTDMECQRTQGGGDFSLVLSNFTETVTSSIRYNYPLAFSGRKRIIGRDCDEFTMDITNATLIRGATLLAGTISSGAASAAPSKESAGTRTMISVCMDAGTGIALDIRLFKSVRSELTQKTVNSSFIELTAVSFADSIDDSEFELPVKFVINDSGCDREEAVALLDPLADYSGPLSIRILNYSLPGEGDMYSTVPVRGAALKAGKIGRVRAGNAGGDLSVFKVCTSDDDCQAASCLFSRDFDCMRLSTDRQACIANKYCRYEDPFCRGIDCNSITTEAGCVFIDKCVWEVTEDKGECAEYSCETIQMKSECESSRLHCLWTEYDEGGGYCSPKRCSDFASKADCESSGTGCQWTGTEPDAFCG